MKTIEAADLFCGGGGTSEGLKVACEEMDRRLDLVAINHNPLAIETHAANHPRARHYCEPVDAVNPRRAVPRGRLHLLWASPECTHHSNARGGKPVKDQSRASAWCVLRWATALRIETILIENVKEFAGWGPIGSNGRPLRRRRGETFQAFLDGLRSLGYRVDWRILNAADYGDATTRERLFVQARLGRKPIVWPERSHAPDPGPTLFGDLPPWRAAREIIDWGLRGASIFGRKRALAPNTLARIAAGLQRFGGKAAEPFLVMLYGTGDVRSLDRPLPTVTASGEHIGLCEPFLIPFRGERDGQARRCHSLGDPLPTVTTIPAFGLCEPFIVNMEHGRPCPPFVVACNHGVDRSRNYPLDRPMPTITTVDAWALASPFLVKFNRTGTAYPLTEPLDTVTTKDRFGLVEVDGHRLDILFRMLAPRELARAMSFPDSYTFKGNREQVVKQIGNAVPRRLATALCKAVLAG